MAKKQKDSKSAAANPNLPGPIAPMALKGILVPTDFSESARKALKYAIAFASQFQAEITLLHVVPDVMDETRLIIAMPELQNDLLKEGRENLDREIAAWGGQSIKLKPCVKRGVPYNEIVDAARQMHSDLILIGTHGRTGLKHVLLGSTTERVIRHAECPVLVVREREHEFV